MTIAVYSTALNNDFVWDDYLNIVHNKAVQSLRHWPQLFSKEYLTSPHELIDLQKRNIGFGELSYRPVMTFTLMLDYNFWKLNAFGYHLTSLCFHILNTLLVFMLANRLLKHHTSSFITAALFAIHPLQSEAVMIASFREDLLACFFFLLAWLTHIKLKEQQQNKFYALSLSTYALALFSKEMAITFLPIIVLYDYFFKSKNPQQNQNKLLTRAYIGYVIITIFYLWIWSGPMAADYSKVSYPEGSVWVNALTMLKVLGTYALWLLTGSGIHPTLPDEHFLAHHLIEFEVWGSAFLLVIILWVILYLRKRQPTISFGLLFLLISLGPVLNILPIYNIISARYLYLPGIGAFLVFAFLIEKHLTHNPYISRLVGFLAIGAIILYCSIITISHAYRYKNELTFRLFMKQYYPLKREVYTQISAAYLRQEMIPEALIYLKIAKHMDPSDINIRLNMADLYIHTRQYELAINELKEALRTHPESTIIHNKLCNLYGQIEMLKESIQCYEKAIKINPKNLYAYYNQAINFMSANDINRSRMLLQQSLTINPDFKPARELLQTLK